MSEISSTPYKGLGRSAVFPPERWMGCHLHLLQPITAQLLNYYRSQRVSIKWIAPVSSAKFSRAFFGLQKIAPSSLCWLVYFLLWCNGLGRGLWRLRKWASLAKSRQKAILKTQQYGLPVTSPYFLSDSCALSSALRSVSWGRRCIPAQSSTSRWV